jgi:pyruvate formate lyase activating enzyme
MGVRNRETLADLLDRLTAPGELYEVVDAEDKTVRCHACALRCLIREGRRGICQVRFNRDGVLHVPFGYVAALQLDPVEKKPFFHVQPGSGALSFGMLGCDLHCSFCQNWVSSQALRDEQAGHQPRPISAAEIVELARHYGASSIASTYNEPLITSEWAVAIFKLAHAVGLRTLYVSNGNASEEVVEYLKPHLDAYKIDLKTMRDRAYRSLGTTLAKVQDGIRMVREAGMWLEIVTLVVPGFNDSNEELWDTAQFIRSISPDVPWHVTAFHPDYQMLESSRTTLDTLLRAAEIGVEAGLNYVYAGNLPSVVGEWENTRCPSCQAMLVRRAGFRVLANHITSEGKCPKCGTAIAGLWT